jgi:hypothetical protein
VLEYLDTGSMQTMPLERQSISPRLLFALIMGGLLLWGVYVAVGAYLYNRNPWRPLIVLASVCAFLGFWLLLLWTQKRKK